MKGLIGLLPMLVRENFVPGDLQRRPEESPVMDTQSSVAAWHDQGADNGPITPVYHLNALLCSRLAPPGGTVVDLACGSGRFPAYLARMRPDLRVVGFDLSAPMVEVGNVALRKAGLGERVSLVQGDMTSFVSKLPVETSLINCLFAIHHLPTLDHVERCLTEIRVGGERTGCGFLLFDLVRPRHLRTAQDYPRVFTPDAPAAFQTDSTNSLIAAYSHTDLRGALDRVFGRGTVAAIRSRVLPLYQLFWRASLSHRDAEGGLLLRRRGHGGGLSRVAWSQYLALRAVLPGLPG